MKISSAKDLHVYQKAYELSMEIFDLSKKWPTEERFALIGQVRRSSRSVCANLREAWAKRRYEAHFVSKLSDCDGENGETDTWLDYARDCGYLPPEQHGQLREEVVAIGKMLGSMLNNPAPFLLSSSPKRVSGRAGRTSDLRPPTSDL